jgi:hypothetical protein
MFLIQLAGMLPKAGMENQDRELIQTLENISITSQ